MQLGIFAKTFPRRSLGETLDAVVAHGFRHVQFNLSSAGLRTLPSELKEKDVQEIAQAFRERGLRMSAISGTFNFFENRPGLERKGSQKEHETASRLMSESQPNFEALEVLSSAARSLGTKIITMSTGTRDTADMWLWHPKNITRGTWEAVVASTKRAVEIASRYDVVMAFEPEVNNVVDSVCKARRLLDSVNSPCLKVVLDPANLLRSGDIPRMREIIEEAFDWLGDDIALVHVKELRTDGHPGNIAPGEGVLDYSFILNELERVGYDGTLIMHGLTEDQVASGAKFLRTMMGFSRGSRETDQP